jgi:hypothetical protein
MPALFWSSFSLADVLADEGGQFEHRHLVFPENFLQLCICVDVAPVGGILKVVLFDVDPQLAHDFGAWQRCAPDDGGQCRAGRERLHESWIRSAFRSRSLLGCGRCRSRSLRRRCFCRRFFCSCHVGILRRVWSCHQRKRRLHWQCACYWRKMRFPRERTRFCGLVAIAQHGKHLVWLTLGVFWVFQAAAIGLRSEDPPKR